MKSGFCNPTSPLWAHARCRLSGCDCLCHTGEQNDASEAVSAGHPGEQNYPEPLLWMGDQA